MGIRHQQSTMCTNTTPQTPVMSPQETHNSSKSSWSSTSSVHVRRKTPQTTWQKSTTSYFHPDGQHLLLQHGFVQAHSRTQTGADEDRKVSPQYAFVHGSDGEVLVDTAQIEVLSVDHVSDQTLGQVEDEGVKLDLRVVLNRGSTGRVRVARVNFERQIDEVRNHRRQDQGRQGP